MQFKHGSTGDLNACKFLYTVPYQIKLNYSALVRISVSEKSQYRD
jgi:hypothetical protein